MQIELKESISVQNSSACSSRSAPHVCEVWCHLNPPFRVDHAVPQKSDFDVFRPVIKLVPAGPHTTETGANARSKLVRAGHYVQQSFSALPVTSTIVSNLDINLMKQLECLHKLSNGEEESFAIKKNWCI